MSKIPSLILATATLGFAGTALAQDVTYETKTETLDAATVSAFTTADTNADGALDRGEYQIYVETKAGEGHVDAVALAESGDYDGAFILHDTNADGLVDSAELATHTMKADEVTEPEPEMVDPMVEDGPLIEE